jgi:hypothetical protein
LHNLFATRVVAAALRPHTPDRRRCVDNVSARQNNPSSFENDLGSRIRLLFESYLYGKHGIHSDQTSSGRNCLHSYPVVKNEHSTDKSWPKQASN